MPAPASPSSSSGTNDGPGRSPCYGGRPALVSDEDAYTSYCECGAIAVVSIGTAKITGLRCPSCLTVAAESIEAGGDVAPSRPRLRLIRGGGA